MTEVLHGLMLLGVGPTIPALTQLQSAVGTDHYMLASNNLYTAETAEGQTTPKEQVQATDASPEPATEGKPSSLELASLLPRAVSPRKSASPPKPPSNLNDMGMYSKSNSAGLPIEDDELRLLFDSYDRDKSGFISKDEFKATYRSFESYGLEMSDKELDALFVKYDNGDGKLTYNEFAILMLKRSKW
jgi:hypothetical protein